MPAAVLQEVSDYELRVRLQDADFQSRAKAVLSDFNTYLADKETWCHHHAPELHKNPVAYYSAEFGFHESLPISAGGLGILAATMQSPPAISASAFVGISLFYREGYFQQAIDATTGRRNFIIRSIRRTFRWNRCWTRPANRSCARWRSA
ncbi:MAG: DUF3417 domain-containing protein [Limisphaerales bacterium]